MSWPPQQICAPRIEMKSWERSIIILMRQRLAAARRDESGFTTAELLGNAALGVLALAAIWAALGGIGDQVIAKVKEQLNLSQ